MTERKPKRKLSEGELSPRQQAYVEALASGKSLDAAAVSAGVTDRTGRAWRNLPQVQAALRAARAAALDAVTTRTVGKMDSALDTLIELMESKDTPATVRVTAAKSVWEAGVKFTEVLDHEQRLAELEAAHAAANTKS